MIGCFYDTLKMTKKKKNIKVSVNLFSRGFFSYPKKGESECQVNQRDPVLIRTVQS